MMPAFVEDDVDPPVRAHSVVDEANDLRVLSHVRLNGGLLAQGELSRECLEPVESPRAQHESTPCSASRAL